MTKYFFLLYKCLMTKTFYQIWSARLVSPWPSDAAPPNRRDIAPGSASVPGDLFKGFQVVFCRETVDQNLEPSIFLHVSQVSPWFGKCILHQWQQPSELFSKSLHIIPLPRNSHASWRATPHWRKLPSQSSRLCFELVFCPEQTESSRMDTSGTGRPIRSNKILTKKYFKMYIYFFWHCMRSGGCARSRWDTCIVKRILHHTCRLQLCKSAWKFYETWRKDPC